MSIVKKLLARFARSTPALLTQEEKDQVIRDARAELDRRRPQRIKENAMSKRIRETR